MGLFDIFKKREKPTEKELSKSIDDFNKLWNMDINDIWNIENKNSFIIAMTGWINRKCNYGENVSALTAEERTVYIINSFQSEVNNGGFDQFLLNSSGAFANELLSSLTAVGANCTVNIYKKAFAMIPHELPANEEQRNALLNELITEDISEIFVSCDRQFYEYPDNLDEMIFQFIMKNKSCFV